MFIEIIAIRCVLVRIMALSAIDSENPKKYLADLLENVDLLIDNLGNKSLETEKLSEMVRQKVSSLVTSASAHAGLAQKD